RPDTETSCPAALQHPLSPIVNTVTSNGAPRSTVSGTTITRGGATTSTGSTVQRSAPSVEPSTFVIVPTYRSSWSTPVCGPTSDGPVFDSAQAVANTPRMNAIRSLARTFPGNIFHLLRCGSGR